MRGTERHQRDRVDRRVLGRRLRRLPEHPDARRVDDEALGRRGRRRRCAAASPPRSSSRARRARSPGRGPTTSRTRCGRSRPARRRLPRNDSGSARLPMTGCAPRVGDARAPSRCRARARSRRVRRARARRARRRRCSRSRRSERSASRLCIIVQPWPATRSLISSTISRGRAASSSSTTMDSGAAATRTTRSRAPRAASPARLHALGLRKGDKVVFWSENRPEWIVAFWGCLLGGIVVVPIDYRASPDFLARVAAIVAREAGPGRPGRARRSRAPVRRAGLEAARARLAQWTRLRACSPDVVDRARRRRRDHLHVGRDRRAEGRRHHAPQRAGEHRPGRARGPEVPEVGHGRSSRSGS